MHSNTGSRLLLVAAALLFSTGGAAIKAATLTSWQVAGFRSGVAFLALMLLLPEARRGWDARLIPAGVAYASTLVLFVLANKLTTSANAIFLQSTAPLYLLFIGPFLLREPIRKGDVLFMTAMIGGMCLFFLGGEHAAATAPDPAKGNVVAVVSGVTWAFTIAGLRWHGKRSGGSSRAMASVVVGNLIACLACLPMALPVNAVRPADFAVIGYLGVFQIGLAYFCMTKAVSRVPAFTASTLLLVEPAVNPVWAWLVHGERPGAWAIAGGALILSATFISTWRQSRQSLAAAGGNRL